MQRIINNAVGIGLLLLILAIIVTGPLAESLPSTWSFDTPTVGNIDVSHISPSFWLFLVVTLLILGFALRNRVGGALILGAVLFSLFLGWYSTREGSDYWLRVAGRCVNSECGPDADYFPTYHGGTLDLNAEEPKTVWIAGKVRVTNPDCHKVNADPQVDVSWDAGVSNVYLEPLQGLEKQLTTVTLQRSCDLAACVPYWRARGIICSVPRRM